MKEKQSETVKLDPQTEALFRRCAKLLKPPPSMTLSQWADTYRVLSAESNAAPGKWNTDNAPYQREIMDAIGDPHVRRVVIMSAAQIGKTAMLMNVLGYYMHYYPAPIMVMEPTIDMGQALSKDFLAPMIRDMPVLSALVDTKSRYSGNTILKKNFPGGHVTIVGANSPVGLRMRPIKVLLADEVDGYPESAGTEGDPLLLAQKRQTTFWDKKTVVVSTPTTRREEWMAVQAIVTGKIPIVGEGVNELIDFGFTNKVTLSGDNKWGGSKADILGNLGDWVDKVLHGGFANTDTLIMGKAAKKAFFNDATVQKMLDNRRMNIGEIAPRDLPNGVRYLGHLTDPNLELYSYGEVYYDDWTDPDTPETKPLIPDNVVVLISSKPNYMMAYGLCTYIDDASQMWVTAQTDRLLRSYVEHHPDRRMVELQAHPLPIPDKVDSWLVATVC